MIDLIEIIAKGKYMMYPLMACSVIAIAVVLDRFLAFARYARIDNRSLRARVLDHFWSGDLDSAALLCAKTPGPISAVLLAGLQAFVRNRERGISTPATVQVKEAMDDYTVHAVSAVEKRLSILSTIGSAAPLMGMTGTVTGMIAAFETMVQASSSAQGKEQIALGISEALITTATGLIIALIAVLPWNYFTTRADAVELEIEESKTQLVDTIAEFESADRPAEPAA